MHSFIALYTPIPSDPNYRLRKCRIALSGSEANIRFTQQAVFICWW